MRQYAKQGAVPALGEIWRPVGSKSTLLMVHLFDIDRIRRLVPSHLKIVAVRPGKTLGGALLGYYGPGSTLVYHEFAVMPALVSFRGALGFWVSHLYVDNPLSVTGGQNMGLPKQQASFYWEGLSSDQAVISQYGEPICAVQYKQPKGTLRFWAGGPAISSLNGDILRFTNRLNAKWGVGEVSYLIPPQSPIAHLGITKPLFSLIGTNMTGYMGENLKVIGKADLTQR